MAPASAWRDLCNDPVRRAEEYVTECVLDLMRAGRTRDVAIGMASERLGISPRKIRSLYYCQPTAVPLSLLDALRVGVARHLREEMAETRRRLAMLDQRITEMETSLALDAADGCDQMGAAARGQADAAGRARRLHGRAVAAADLARRLDGRGA